MDPSHFPPLSAGKKSSHPTPASTLVFAESESAKAERKARGIAMFAMFFRMFSEPFRALEQWESMSKEEDYTPSNDYSIPHIFRPLIGQTTTWRDAGKFPDSIKYFIWCEEGVNDEKPWLLLCQLKNQKYAYYTASCDYTGFDCCGGMSLYIANSVDTLVQMAMGDSDRTKYQRFLNRKNKKPKEDRHSLTLGDFM
jgi:hypothetical protein